VKIALLGHSIMFPPNHFCICPVTLLTTAATSPRNQFRHYVLGVRAGHCNGTIFANGWRNEAIKQPVYDDLNGQQKLKKETKNSI